MADRSSYIQLYDHEESAGSAYKWQIENKQAGISFKDSDNVRPMKFYAKDFKFYDGGAVPGPAFDLKVRMAAADSAAASAQSKANSNESDLAAETVSRVAGDATQAANLTAEITARATAVAAVQAEVDAEESKRASEDVLIVASVSAEAAARILDVNTEQSRAEAAEAAIQAQISSILSNATAGTLDSLAEIVAAFQAADSTLSGTVGSMNTRLLAAEATLAQLLNE